MAKLSPTQDQAVSLLSAAGGVLDYQLDLYGFAKPGASRAERIGMNTAKALVRAGVAKSTRTKPSRRGDLIDQLTLADNYPVELVCSQCQGTYTGWQHQTGGICQDCFAADESNWPNS